MRTIFIIIIFLFFYSLGFSQSLYPFLESLQSKVETFKRVGNFIDLDMDAIEKFNQDKLKKSFISKKRKIAINIIEQDLLTLEYFFYLQDNLSKDMSRPLRVHKSLDFQALNEIKNLIKEQKIRLETISEIKGLQTFSNYSDSLYKYMENSLMFNKKLVEILSNGFENLTEVEPEFIEYYENFYTNKNLINLIEIEIFQRLIQLHHNLENFKKKRFAFILHS